MAAAITPSIFNTCCNSMSLAYKKNMISTRVQAIRQAISEISPRIAADSYILDNACGPGVVTGEVKRLRSEAHIVAAVTSLAILALVRDLIVQTPINHVIMNFGIAIMGEDAEGPLKADRELYHLLKPGDVCIITAWTDQYHSPPYTYWIASEMIRPSRSFKEDKISFDWFCGSWLMSILEEGGFGVRVGSGADLGTRASVSTVNTYTNSDSLGKLVEKSMMFQTLYCPGHIDDAAQRLKDLVTEEIPRMKNYSELAGNSTLKMVTLLGVVWKQNL